MPPADGMVLATLTTWAMILDGQGPAVAGRINGWLRLRGDTNFHRIQLKQFSFRAAGVQKSAKPRPASVPA